MLRAGRFGPYVTDGTTNASLRQGDDQETITHERAVELLADRRAAGPPAKRAKKAAKARKTAKKTTKKTAKAATKTTKAAKSAKTATKAPDSRYRPGDLTWVATPGARPADRPRRDRRERQDHPGPAPGRTATAGAVSRHRRTGGHRPRDRSCGPSCSTAGLPPVAERSEALLMAADRAQHVAEVVAPALAAGRWVVTDRFSGSTLAYQGYGRGLDLDRAPPAGRLGHGRGRARPERPGRRPSRGGPGPAGAGGRRPPRESGRGLPRPGPPGYLALAAGDPGAWVVIDGEGGVDEVAGRLRAAVVARLGNWPAGAP